MPKKIKELSALEVKRINKPGRHAVGGVSGLLLHVKETGSKSWILRVMVGNKRRSIGLGGFPDVLLAQAREKARRMKEIIAEGVDPVVERQVRRQALIKAQMAKMTFAEASRLCHQAKKGKLKSEKNSRLWIASIEKHALPHIGDIPVDEIEIQNIEAVLRPIWQEKTETAIRLRQRLEHILSWATVSGHRSGENPARWKGRLELLLAKPSEVHKKKHYAALPWKEIGSFMQQLRTRQGMSARCLEFIILTACRSGEARLAVWDEIDFDSKLWTIPGARMKARREHTVPLTDDAIKLLKNLPRFEGSPYIFPAARGGALSDMAISMLCRRMKVNAVPHGFRSTFRDWAAETTNFPRDVCEMALAHTIGSKTEAAYRRGDLLAKRCRLMEAWAGYCNKVQAGEQSTVTPIRRAQND